jgi:geranylgeranyl diphosphate synthase type II
MIRGLRYQRNDQTTYGRTRWPDFAPVDLDTDRETIALRLDELLEWGSVPVGGPVHRAMCYAVRGEAKRIRPLLALRVARFLGAERPITVRAATAVELLHCASLIVDDLPCMDNDSMRRNRPATHVAFGEPAALLAAFGLVSVAGRSVLEPPIPPGDFARLLVFQTELFRALDSSGLLEAQALDLEQARLPKQVVPLNEGKTVPFFQLAVRAGMMFADLTAGLERQLLDFGQELGRAFQSHDDLMDGNEARGSEDLAGQFDRSRHCLAGLEGDRRPLEELLDNLQHWHSRKAL